MHLPDLVDDVHNAISPRLAALRRIGEGAGLDAAAAEHDLAVLLADLIREDCEPPWLGALRAQLDRIEHTQKRIEMSQSDIDAATTALTGAATTFSTVAADLGTVQANIQAEIAALEAANPTADTTALNAAVAGLAAPQAALQAADASLDSLETPPVEPAPVPDAS